MRTVILCGGKGTRAYPHTVDVPKPLLEIDGQPILRRSMDVYAAQGFTDFVLAAGYKIELDRPVRGHTVPGDWRVEVVDTGEDTNTGGRVRRCRDVVGDTVLRDLRRWGRERQPSDASRLPPRSRPAGDAHHGPAAVAVRNDRLRRIGTSGRVPREAAAA